MRDVSYASAIALNTDLYYRAKNPRGKSRGGGQIMTASGKAHGNGGEEGHADHHCNRIIGCKYSEKCFEDCPFDDCRWQSDGDY